MGDMTWANSDTRKRAAMEADRFRIIPGTTYLERPISEDPADWDSKIKLAIPVLDLFLNGLTRLYVFGNGPTRTLEFAEGTPEYVSALWEGYLGLTPPADPDDETVSYNVFMRQLHEETLYHGTVLVMIQHRGELPPLPVIFRPWQYDVVLDERDRRKFKTIKILLNGTKDEVSQGTPSDDQRWELWTSEWITEVDAAGDPVEGAVPQSNPYRRLPFIRVASDPLFYDFWCPCLADFVVDICKVLAGLDTEQVDLSYWLFSQPTIDGDLAEAKDKIVYAGKGVLVRTRDGGKYSRVPAGVQMADFLASVDALFFRIALSIGLSPAMFLRRTWEARDQSSLALREAETGPLDSRESDIGWMTRVEQRIAALVALVEAAHRTGTDADPARWMPRAYRVNFPSITARAKTPLDLREDNRLALDKGLKAAWQVAQEIDPELTEAQARAQVEEVAAGSKPTGTVYEVIAMQRFTLSILAAAPGASPAQKKQIIDAIKSNNLAALPMEIIEPALLAGNGGQDAA